MKAYQWANKADKEKVSVTFFLAWQIFYMYHIVGTIPGSVKIKHKEKKKKKLLLWRLLVYLNQPRLDAWDKRSDLVHWEDLEGAGGEGGGKGDREGEHM